MRSWGLVGELAQQSLVSDTLAVHSGNGRIRFFSILEANKSATALEILRSTIKRMQYNKIIWSLLPVSKALAGTLIDHNFRGDYFTKRRKELVEILIGKI